jgi:hypothetical protein
MQHNSISHKKLFSADVRMEHCNVTALPVISEMSMSIEYRKTWEASWISCYDEI